MLDFILLALGLGFFAHPSATRVAAKASHAPRFPVGRRRHWLSARSKRNVA